MSIRSGCVTVLLDAIHSNCLHDIPKNPKYNILFDLLSKLSEEKWKKSCFLYWTIYYISLISFDRSAGISMSLVQSKDGLHYFTFEHSRDYQQVQFKFMDAVDSMNNNNILVRVSQLKYLWNIWRYFIIHIQIYIRKQYIIMLSHLLCQTSFSPL